MIKTDYTKCLFCKWQDRNNAQCFDGHLQYPHKKDCEGYTYSELPAQQRFKFQEDSKHD